MAPKARLAEIGGNLTASFRAVGTPSELEWLLLSSVNTVLAMVCI